MNITIDSELKLKCPRTALAAVTARVRSGNSPAALIELLQSRAADILKLPEPRIVLESAAIQVTRAGYKKLGKDPARY
jgi:hypothetical protein